MSTVTTSIAGANESKVDEICKDIDDFLGDKEQLDIYQVVAFNVRQKGYCCGSCYDLFRAFMCAVAQISSIIVLFYYYLAAVDPEQKVFCDINKGQILGNGNNVSRIMAVSYSVILSMMLFAQYLRNQDAGFYEKLSFEHHDYGFISSKWLYFGRIINGSVTLSSFYVCFMIVYFAETPVDIILNSMAVLFIEDLDNMIVSDNDYRDLKKQFTHNKNDIREKVGGYNEKKTCYGRCYYIILLIVLGPTILGAIAAPVVIFFCY